MPSLSSTPVRLGLIDAQLDNWHANTFLGLLRGAMRDRGAVVTGVWALDAPGGREWAAKNELPFVDDAEALDATVDAYMVLAPSDPQLHLQLCERVFPFAKPTYVDKTFAPDLATARRIFELADQCRTPVQTSSVLRYTSVQAFVCEQQQTPRHVVTWGSGRSIEEYAIHPVELAVSLLGADAQRAMCRGGSEHVQVIMDYSAGRTAVVNVMSKPNTPFAASVTTEKTTHHLTVDVNDMWARGLGGILDFLTTGEPVVDRRESLLVRRVLDLIAEPAGYECWQPVDEGVLVAD